MEKLDYVAIDIDAIEDPDTRAFAVQANETARLVAETWGMVSDIYKIFEQLKPLIGGLPTMPKGLVPPMISPFAPPSGRR